MRFIVLGFLATMSLFLASCQQEKALGGYEYKHHIKTKGKKPKVGEVVYFHVSIFAGDKELNNSRLEMNGEPAKFKLPEVKKEDKKPVSPIVAALNLMSVGDSMSIFMPIDTIQELKAQFPDAKNLAYHIKLVDIKTEEEFNKMMDTERAAFQVKQEEGIKKSEEVTALMKGVLAQFKSKKLPLQDVADGIKVHMTTQGTGAKVENGKVASVQYYGALMNGNRFDDSFSRGMQPFNLKVGEKSVIAGWEKGLLAFSEGSKGFLFIPSAEGYGPQGAGESIPPNADLVFYIEVEKVK
jgi:FKBP-type peptidyl-prolyl cis-trans isomerase FkpA